MVKIQTEKRLLAIEILVVVIIIAIIAGFSILALVSPTRLEAGLCNVMPGLEKEIGTLKRAGTNPERLKDMEELKGLIEARFQRTGFQPDKAPYESTGTLEDHLRLALASLEGVMELHESNEYQFLGGSEEPGGLEKTWKEDYERLKKMKALITRLVG